MASSKYRGAPAAASFAPSDRSTERVKWSGPARLAVLSSTAVISWLPVAALGYVFSKLIG